MNATVTCRMMGPDGVSSCSRISQSLFTFLIKHLGEYLGKTIFKPNSGKYLVYNLGRIEVRSQFYITFCSSEVWIKKEWE